MMQNATSLIITFAASISLATLSAGPSVSSAATNLSYGSPLPSTHVLNKEAIEPFLELTEEKSGGEISWRFFPGGTTAKLPAVMSSIANGVVDSGYMINSLTPREQSYTTLVGRLGSLGENPLVMAGAVNELLLLNCPQCVNQMVDQNITPLAYTSTTPFLLICKEDYGSASDLEGMRFRAPGSYGRHARAWGGVPVNVPPTDMFEAMERGQADCTFGPEGHITNYSLHEVANSVTDYAFGMYITGHVFNMNADRWGGLSKEEKTLFLDNMPKMVSTSVMAYKNEAESAREQAIEAGMVYRDAPDEIKNIIEDYRANLISDIEQAGADMGVDDIRPIVEKMPALVEKWEGIVESANGDMNEYEKALHREIYSKYNP